MPIIGIISSYFANLLQDLFTRTTSGSLGTATSGQTWGATRGVWFANGSQAQSDGAASDYPIASINFKTDNTLSASVSGGVGLAFWVTDSGSWWAAFPTYTTSTSTVTTCTGAAATCDGAGCTPTGCCSGVSYSTSASCSGYQTGLANTSTCQAGCGYTTSTTSVCDQNQQTLTTTNQFCGSYTTSTACDAGYGTFTNVNSCCGSYTTGTQKYCPTGNLCTSDNKCYSGSGCTGSFIMNAVDQTTYSCYSQNTNYYTGFTGTSTTTTYNCHTSLTTTTTGSCTTNASSTVTNYNSNLRTIKSVSNTVSVENTTQVATSTSGYQTVGSMSVNTSGNTIVATAYTNTDLTSQLGSPVTVNAVSPTKGTRVGIIKAPTTNNQGSTLDNFTAV